MPHSESPFPSPDKSCPSNTTAVDYVHEGIVATPYVPQLSPFNDALNRDQSVKLEVTTAQETMTPPSLTSDSRTPTLISPISSHAEGLEKMNVRLASAFVIFFVFGWGDGGKILCPNSSHGLIILCISYRNIASM